MEIVDAILNSEAITDPTRRGVCAALDLAHAKGRRFPTARDCVLAAIAEKASLGSVCGAWGYVRDEAKAGAWLNARFTYTDPSQDERRGYFQTSEALLAFMAFCTFAELPVPFQFSYKNRAAPRRR